MIKIIGEGERFGGVDACMQVGKLAFQRSIIGQVSFLKDVFVDYGVGMAALQRSRIVRHGECVCM